MRESGLIIKDQINVFAKVAYFNYYFFATFFTLAKIFILKFSWSCKFFVSQFSLFLIFFKSQVLLNVSQIAKCDMIIQTMLLLKKNVMYDKKFSCKKLLCTYHSAIKVIKVST